MASPGCARGSASCSGWLRGGWVNLSVMTIHDIIAWDDTICMVGIRYCCWLAPVNLLKYKVK